MMRLNRLRHLLFAVDAANCGEWHDLGKATHGLRAWFHRHGLTEGRPDNGGINLRHVRATPKGLAAADAALQEYRAHNWMGSAECVYHALLVTPQSSRKEVP